MQFKGIKDISELIKKAVDVPDPDIPEQTNNFEELYDAAWDSVYRANTELSKLFDGLKSPGIASFLTGLDENAKQTIVNDLRELDSNLVDSIHSQIKSIISQIAGVS